MIYYECIKEKEGELMTSFYPIHVNIEGRKCLVVGGGKTAERKVKTLLRYGSKVVVVSPKATKRIEGLLKKKKILWHERTYRVADLKGAFLVFCATSSEKLNREISRDARKRKIMVNVVDAPKDCDFISPSLIERGHLKVSISTDGLAPLLSRRLREELEGKLGKEYKQYTTLITKVRSAILKNKTLSSKAKKEKLDHLLFLNLRSKLKKGGKVSYRSVLKQLGVSG
jgi:precorrin-2 dehydrogenase/sirohydrochlorin ferrochelatase